MKDTPQSSNSPVMAGTGRGNRRQTEWRHASVKRRTLVIILFFTLVCLRPRGGGGGGGGGSWLRNLQWCPNGQPDYGIDKIRRCLRPLREKEIISKYLTFHCDILRPLRQKEKITNYLTFHCDILRPLRQKEKITNYLTFHCDILRPLRQKEKTIILLFILVCLRPLRQNHNQCQRVRVLLYISPFDPWT